MIQYERTSAFTRDLKKLLKRFRTLEDDLEIAQKNAIELYHLKGIVNLAIFPVTGSGSHPEWQFFKVKKFACRALKGRGAMSGIRVIYAYSETSKKIVYLEIYFKADQENERRDRIQEFSGLARAKNRSSP